MTRREWADQLGGADRLARLPDGYLVNTGALAEAVLCCNKPSCGGHHLIDEHPAGGFVATSDDPEAECPSFRLSREECLCWRLDLPHLMRDIAETLSITPAPEPLGGTLWRLGAITKRRVPVLLSFAPNNSDHVRNAAIAAAQKQETFVFFVPKEQSASQPLEQLVTSNAGRLGILADHIALDQRRQLVAVIELEERWRDLAAEPASRQSPLRVPPGTPWSDIVIRVTDRETMKVSTCRGGEVKTFSRDGLGLNNQRRDGTPKQVWSFLLFIAGKNALPRPKDQRDRDMLKNRVRDLNRLLQRIVDGIENEPPIRLGRTRDAPGYHWALSVRSDV